ncbi:MAG: arginase family protein [Gemmatimonadaceae bacterium]
MTRLHLLFPQWQGAGDVPGVGRGAHRLRRLTEHVPWVEVPIHPCTAELPVENGIRGLDVLRAHLRVALAVVNATVPSAILTVGGDCSVELAPVTYLNARYRAGLAVVWLDAHADLNTPESSPSATLHGMALRCILGEGEGSLVGDLPSRLRPDQVLLAGVRDLDAAERDFIAAAGMCCLGVEQLRADASCVASWLADRGARHAYVHIDLDVLDPGEFAEVAVPAACGLTLDGLEALLDAVRHAGCEVVGAGVTEHVPSDAACDRDPFLKGLLESVSSTVCRPTR